VDDPRSAAALLRAVGLMADGPVLWGRPTGASGPGIYLVELPEPAAVPPLDLAVVGKWVERLPDLRLDGDRPTSRALAARISAFWWPDATVLYAGAAKVSIGGRVRALTTHVLGDRQPHADGHWLGLLRDRAHLRIWWASTDAPEEYLDAVLDAFAATRPTPSPDRPAGAPVLPWAVTRRPTGERVVHGVAGSVAPEVTVPPPPPTRRVELADAAADGTAPEARNAGSTRRTNAPGAIPRRPAPARTSPGGRAPSATIRRAPEPVRLTAEAMERMRAELVEMTQVTRKEVIHRVKTAREHGDLKENAEYHAAREEQSFLEGRIRTLEERLRNAVVIAAPDGATVALGSTVTVEADGLESVFTIVGTAEADPASGRLSEASPVGRALLGAAVGATLEVRTPRGLVIYRVRAIA
jgi:transcription elongation factor GreA